MVLWRQDSHVNRYVKYSEDLKGCRDYIFNQQAVHRSFRTYKPCRTYEGVPLITYKLKNGEVFELPILEDFIDDYDYNVVVIDFVCSRRAAIFGYRDTADMCHLSEL